MGYMAHHVASFIYTDIAFSTCLMINHNMRILFLGDYSNLHSCLAQRLREEGHDVTVVSDGGRYMETAYDILLDRTPGKLGAIKYLCHVSRLIPKIKDYDVVQLINPHFLSLRPEKIRYFFDILRKQNRSIFLTLAGNDYYFVKACLDGEMFKFSEFKRGKEETEYESMTKLGARWISPGMKEHCDYIYSNIDGAVSILPEYDMAARPYLGDRLAFANIPVNLSSVPFKELDFNRKIQIFIGLRGGMEIQKGTARMLELCRCLEKENPDKCEVVEARNLPLKEYLERMSRSHIVLDQLYSYSPGTNGLQAMALGKATGTGAQPEYYEYIHEQDKEAILPLSPLISDDEWMERLRTLIHDPDKMSFMGREGRRIVETYNSDVTVAGKFLKHWHKILK